MLGRCDAVLTLGNLPHSSTRQPTSSPTQSSYMVKSGLTLSCGFLFVTEDRTTSRVRVASFYCLDVNIGYSPARGTWHVARATLPKSDATSPCKCLIQNSHPQTFDIKALPLTQLEKSHWQLYSEIRSYLGGKDYISVSGILTPGLRMW